MSRFLKVRGISRAPDEGDPRRRKVLQVHFNHELTGDQMAEFMAYALAFMTAEQRAAQSDSAQQRGMDDLMEYPCSVCGKRFGDHKAAPGWIGAGCPPAAAPHHAA